MTCISHTKSYTNGSERLHMPHRAIFLFRLRVAYLLYILYLHQEQAHLPSPYVKELHPRKAGMHKLTVLSPYYSALMFFFFLRNKTNATPVSRTIPMPNGRNVQTPTVLPVRGILKVDVFVTSNVHSRIK